MEIVTIILRILHIFGAVAWVGGAWLFVFFIEPTVSTLGPDSGKFMNYLVTVRRYPVYLTTAAIVTLLAGILLFGLKWGPVWNTSKGITFLIGGLFGIAAGAVGGMTGASAGRLIALGGEVAKQGKPPTQEQAAEIRGLQERMRSLGKTTAVLTSIALLAMAVARYV